MKIIENEIYYHCNSKSNQNPYPLLNVGQVIEIGNELNPFMSSYEIQAPPLLNQSQALINAITFYWHYARETVFEDVRKKVDVNLPSRHRSLWVGNYNNIKQWQKQFQNNEKQLVKLSLTGTIFECDASFVEGNPIPLSMVREEAKQYWNGDITDENKIEYLFVGEAKVLEIL